MRPFFASCFELGCGEGAHQLHDTSNSMHFIIKENIYFYTEYSRNEEYLRNYLKGGTAISYMV